MMIVDSIIPKCCQMYPHPGVIVGVRKCAFEMSTEQVKPSVQSFGRKVCIFAGIALFFEHFSNLLE